MEEVRQRIGEWLGRIEGVLSQGHRQSLRKGRLKALLGCVCDPGDNFLELLESWNIWKCIVKFRIGMLVGRMGFVGDEIWMNAVKIV